MNREQKQKMQDKRKQKRIAEQILSKRSKNYAKGEATRWGVNAFIADVFHKGNAIKNALKDKFGGKSNE